MSISRVDPSSFSPEVELVGLLICASYIARSAPGARPAAATPAVQPPCQHTRHLSDHFRASTLPKGAGRRKQCVQAVYRRPGPGSSWGTIGLP